MRSCFFLLLLLSCFSAGTIYAQTTNNAEMQQMYDEDQNGRKATPIDWKVLNKLDSTHRVRTYELLAANKLITGKDYYNAAMIFQHGSDTIASVMAIQLMRRALELDTTINRWLLAAATDRDLMRRKEPQIYGTQYIMSYSTKKWQLYTIDSTKVTDAERQYYHVETLAEQRVKERRMNQKTIREYYGKDSSAEAVIAFIYTERKKEQPEYNVSEDGINDFAYQLLNTGKSEDALKIFRLNTELYPEGYNTWDSYGECLLKTGRKAEALKAYRKSLDLNPGNTNASKILEADKS